MSTPYRFRHVNEWVGGMVLLTTVLLVTGVVLAGRAQHWFDRQEELRTHFPPEGTFGLQYGAEVHILGTPVGSVLRIEVDDQGAMEGVFRIRSDFARFVREDSIALIKKKFGVAGDAYVEITVGKGPQLAIASRTYILCQKDTELTEMAASILEQVRVAVVPALEELEKLLSTYRRLGERLESPGDKLQLSIAHVESLLAGLERGEGTAGRLLKDSGPIEQVEQILGKVSVTMEELEATVKQIQSVIEDVRKASSALPAVADTVRGEMRDVPGLVLQTRSTLKETETLIAGVQRHWLLRNYIEREDPMAVITVQEIPPLLENLP